MIPTLLRVAGGSLLRNGVALVRGEADCCCALNCLFCSGEIPEDVDLTVDDLQQFGFFPGCDCSPLIGVITLHKVADICRWLSDCITASDCTGNPNPTRMIKAYRYEFDATTSPWALHLRAYTSSTCAASPLWTTSLTESPPTECTNPFVFNNTSVTPPAGGNYGCGLKPSTDYELSW